MNDPHDDNHDAYSCDGFAGLVVAILALIAVFNALFSI